MLIKDSYRRQGCGSLLMFYTLFYLKENNCGYIQLIPTRDSAPFYTKVGFVHLRIQNFMAWQEIVTYLPSKLERLLQQDNNYLIFNTEVNKQELLLRSFDKLLKFLPKSSERQANIKKSPLISSINKKQFFILRDLIEEGFAQLDELLSMTEKNVQKWEDINLLVSKLEFLNEKAQIFSEKMPYKIRNLEPIKLEQQIVLYLLKHFYRIKIAQISAQVDSHNQQNGQLQITSAEELEEKKESHSLRF